MAYRRVRLFYVPIIALALLSLSPLLSLSSCSSTSNTVIDAEEAIRIGNHLKELADEREQIAAAALTAYQNHLITNEQAKQIADYGIASGTTIDIAHASFDAYRLRLDSALSSTALDALVKAADISMIALRALASSAGVEWRNQ